MMRGGQKVENILSMPSVREALRMRRLIGTPFARKFLLDQEYIFKKCTKRMIEKVEQIMETQGKVDAAKEFMNYSCDLLSFTPLWFGDGG